MTKKPHKPVAAEAAPATESACGATGKVVTSWRDAIPVHPAAELFPLMSPAELKELAEDIEKNGIINLPVTWQAGPDAPLQVLDGRNRLDAMEEIWGEIDPVRATRRIDSSVDPYDYVISVNIKRRHLDAKQKRELIKKLLKERPEKSDRQIGKAVKADGKTVGEVRRELEERPDIPHVETRTDTKGRAQPARKGAGKPKSAGKAKSAGKGGGKAKGGEPDLGAADESSADEVVRLHEKIGLAVAFTALVSIGRALTLKDLPGDIRASELRELAERIRELAAEVEAARAEETVH
jgi:hypothetical protein